MYYWVWSILLLVVGLGLAVLEVFFPSAGILGFLAASAIFASLVMGFLQGTAFGIGMVVVAIFGVPTVIILGFRYWPRTAMGRRVILAAPRPEDVTPAEEQRRYLRSLVGKVGRAKCKMLPGGAVTIDGRTIEALSEGPPIEAGELVRVIQVRGMRLVVRRLEDEPPAESAPDPLRRPIETIAQDPFAEPPTEGQQV